MRIVGTRGIGSNKSILTGRARMHGPFGVLRAGGRALAASRADLFEYLGRSEPRTAQIHCVDPGVHSEVIGSQQSQRLLASASAPSFSAGSGP